MEEIDENPFRRSSSGMDHPHLSRQSGMGVTARVNEVPSVYAALTDALFGMNQSWNGNWNGNGTNNYQKHSTVQTSIYLIFLWNYSVSSLSPPLENI